MNTKAETSSPPGFKKVFAIKACGAYEMAVYVIFSLAGYKQAVAEFFLYDDDLANFQQPTAFPCLLQFEAVRDVFATDRLLMTEIDSNAFLIRLDHHEVAEQLIGKELITLENLLGAWARDAYDVR